MLDSCFAVVDLETTGNDPLKDHIIELSIVFVKNNEVISSYSTLLSDASDIPAFVTELTSITLEDIKGAPKFNDISNEVYELLENCCFIAHNIEFDLNFLKVAFQNTGIHFQPHLTLDTVDLSKIFFPTLSSYQLGMLSETLNLSLKHAHRAYDDALATAKLFIKILERINQLDKETIIRLYNISKYLETNVSDLLFASLSENNHRDADYTVQSLSIQHPKFNFESNHKITIEDLYKNFIDQNNFKHRQDQLDLIYTIYSALKENKNIALEAYTGLGKTEAILIASIVYTNETKQHVLISTSKKILQDQMYYQSLIRLLESSKLNELPVSMLKGKTNYVDIDTILKLLSFKDDNYEIVMLKMKLLVWLTETITGDLGEISLKGPERLYYDTAHFQINSNDNYFYNRAVEHAKNSRICITNHYFIEECLSELDNKYLIVDEAHQVLNTVERQSITEYKYMDLKFLLSQIGINNKDKMLKEYLEHNDIRAKDFLVRMLTDLNKTIDDVFSSLRIEEIKRAIQQLNHSNYLIDFVLKSIVDTNNYESLYNYLKHFQFKLKDMQKSLTLDNYTIHQDNNYQKTALLVNNNSKDRLFHHLKGLHGQVLISGTLEVNGSFNHLEPWFLDEFDTKIIANDNLFKEVELFIPNDIHDLNDRDSYIEDLVDYLSTYHSIKEDKVIVLFTNYKLLNEVYQFLLDGELFDIPIIKQNKNDTPSKLLLQYNQLQNCILLATESFTEGINLENLNDRTIFLTKLPFPVPTGKGFRHFYKHDLPDAVFMFRQIVGRIKRDDSDRGRVVLFDERLLEKPYRNAFLKYFNEKSLIHGDRTAFIEMLSRL